MKPPEGFVIDEDIAPPAGFQLDEPAPGRSVGGFARNVGSDVVNTAKGLGSLAKGLVTAPVDTAIGVATHLPGAIVDEGKRLGIGELLTGHPVNAAQKFGGALYDKPMTTILDVLPAAGAVAKGLGIGGKVARGAELAAEAGDVAVDAARMGGGMADDVARVAAGAPKPINLPPEAAQILKEAPTGAPAAAGAAESVPLGATFQDTVANLGRQVPDAVKQPMAQVRDFWSQKYGAAAKKPGLATKIADYAEEHSRNMTTKASGASYGQLRKIGEEDMQSLQDLMLDRGIISPKVGPIGAKKMVEEFHAAAGDSIGNFRKAAAERGGVHDMDSVVSQIRSKLDDKYTSGMYSGQKGTYAKAINELKKLDGNPAAVSEKITELFKEARRADPLREPSGPLADVARQLRAQNEGLIQKTLSPAEFKAYQAALDEYGAMTQIREFMKRKNFRDASGRLGPGSGVFRQGVQSFFDMIGYRGQAQVMKKFADWLRSNPEAASNPKAMFQKYIDEAAEAVDDVMDAR